MWLRFEGDARAAAGRDGPTLHTEGFGIAELRTQASEHVQLSFRYQRRASGVGVVLFSLSANAAARRGYQVELRDDAVVIAREEDGRVVQLASGALVAAAGAWHEVAVTRAGGRLSVAVGGAEIVGVEDPRPLPPGRVALGSWIGGAFDFRDVRLESKASSAAGREGDRFRLGTGDASVRGEWQLLSGARLEGARAEALHVPAGGRAAWEAQASPSSSLACRFRGNAVVRVGRVGGRSGAGDVWLGVGPEGVRLVLVEGGTSRC